MTDQPLDAHADDADNEGSLLPGDAAEIGNTALPGQAEDDSWSGAGSAEAAGTQSDAEYAEGLTAGADTRESDATETSMLLDAPGGPADPMNVKMRWDAYASAHHIGIELKHLEDEVRDLLEPIDQRRKRKFSGTRRWHELEDDLRALRFSGRLPEATIAKILQLIAKRHTLYGRLSFLSATRPTWNT